MNRFCPGLAVQNHAGRYSRNRRFCKNAWPTMFCWYFPIIEIHWVRNTGTDEVDDFKVKY